jgi:hypothetical protein
VQRINAAIKVNFAFMKSIYGYMNRCSRQGLTRLGSFFQC